VIKNYRATHPNVLAVSGGGFAMPGTLESQKVQSFFQLKVMGGLDYAAVNVTPSDLNYGVEALRQAALAEKVDLVSSNLKRKANGQFVFKPYVVKNMHGIRVALLGVMEEGEPIAPVTTEGDALQVIPPQEAVAALLPEVRAKADVVVVFSHLTQRKTQQLADEVRGIDIAISGKDGFVNYKPTEVGTDSTGKTLILEAGERGKYIGALTFVVSEHGKMLRYNHEVHSLDKNVKDDSLMALQVTALKDQLKEVRKREAVEQVVGQTSPGATQAAHEKYLGGQICSRCHADAFTVWKKSPHASALTSLEAKAMEGSAECLKCHVTGYNQTSGYPSAPTEMGAVSCEQCHGFGTLHGDKTFIAKPGAETCKVCHDQKNSPNFDYKKYCSQIAH
jgi:2',3'-cyclic-nucleotide 2'-phosphodiesterase (5'-nucleotidase family)